MQADKALEGLKTKLEELKKALDITPDLRFKIKHRLLKFPDIDQVYKHYQSFGNQMDKIVVMKAKRIGIERGQSKGMTEFVSDKLTKIKLLTNSIFQMYGSAQQVQQCIIKAHVTVLKDAHNRLTEITQYFEDSYKIGALVDPISFQYRCEKVVLNIYDDQFPGMLKQFPFIALPDNTAVDIIIGEKEVIDASSFTLIKDESYRQFLKECCVFLDFTEQKRRQLHDRKETSHVTADCFFPNKTFANSKPSKPSKPTTLFRSYEQTGISTSTHEIQCIDVRNKYKDFADALNNLDWRFTINERLIQFKHKFNSSQTYPEQNIHVVDNQYPKSPGIAWMDAHIAFKEFLQNTYTYLDHIISKREPPFDKILIVYNLNIDYDYKLNTAFSKFVKQNLHADKYDGFATKESYFRDFDNREKQRIKQEEEQRIKEEKQRADAKNKTSTPPPSSKIKRTPPPSSKITSNPSDVIGKSTFSQFLQATKSNEKSKQPQNKTTPKQPQNNPKTKRKLR